MKNKNFAVMESFSGREKEVFLRIGAGERTSKIAEDLGLSPKTVSTYKARIAAKLMLRDVHDVGRAAVMATTNAR